MIPICVLTTTRVGTFNSSNIATPVSKNSKEKNLEKDSFVMKISNHDAAQRKACKSMGGKVDLSIPLAASTSESACGVVTMTVPESRALWLNVICSCNMWFVRTKQSH